MEPGGKVSLSVWSRHCLQSGQFLVHKMIHANPGLAVSTAALFEDNSETLNTKNRQNEVYQHHWKADVQSPSRSLWCFERNSPFASECNAPFEPDGKAGRSFRSHLASAGQAGSGSWWQIAMRPHKEFYCRACGLVNGLKPNTATLQTIRIFTQLIISVACLSDTLWNSEQTVVFELVMINRYHQMAKIQIVI